MIITDFNKWDGYQFGNKLLGLNNLLQIANYYGQDYFFTHFDGIEIFDIKKETKKYNNETFQILNLDDLLIKKNKEIKLDNNIIYYLKPCLVEFFYKYNSLSTFEIFKLKNKIESKKKIIGIHFRGTDFNLWDKNAILPYDYYENSINFVLNEIDTEFEIILFTDDHNLDSYIKTINFLKNQSLNFKIGNINNFKEDFILMSSCDYIISTPSTFCIMAAICGKKDKKIIHNHRFLIDYKNKSDYFRDVFWKNLISNNNDKNYKLYKLI